MVNANRDIQRVIVDTTPPTSSSLSNPVLLDRRLKAIRSCSSWNNALLNGRRTRGPQWDYATASYHVSKYSPEYYRGVTPSNPSVPPNHYVPSSSSSQYPSNTQSRASFNFHPLDRHPQQLHMLQQDPDQFSNRIMRHPSQHSQPSAHARSMGNSIPSANYPLHPAHLQQVGTHATIPSQLLNNLTNPLIIPPNHPDAKPALFSAQAPGLVNPSNPVTGPNLLSSPHFQPGVPPTASHGIHRHMSTTPSLSSSQSEHKDALLTHPAYQNSAPPNQHQIEPPSSTAHMGPPPQSFSPAQHHLLPSSFEKTPVEGMVSPTHPQALRSPAPHGLEPQIPTSNRKFHAMPSPSLHTLSQRPLTPRSAQNLAPTGGPTNPTHQVFQPIQVGYPSSGNGPSAISISSQARNMHYNPNNQPNSHINLKPPLVGQQSVLQVPNLSSQAALNNESNQFNPLNQFQSQPASLINNNSATLLMTHNNNPKSPAATMGRSMPPNFNQSQFYQPTMIPPVNSSITHPNSYSTSTTNQQQSS